MRRIRQGEKEKICFAVGLFRARIFRNAEVSLFHHNEIVMRLMDVKDCDAEGKVLCLQADC